MDAVSLQATLVAKQIIKAIPPPATGRGILVEDSLVENIAKALEEYANAILEKAELYANKKKRRFRG